MKSMTALKQFQISVRNLSIFSRNLKNATNYNDNDDKPKPIYYLSENEKFIKQMANRFSKEIIAPYVKQMEKEGKLRQSILDALFQNGLMAIEIDEKYGGTDANFMSSILVIEEISQVDPAVAVLVDIHNTLVINIFKKYANQRHKDKYLPMLAANSASCICISEPNSGSDAFSMKTTAKLEGDNYILNGTKMWISNSDLAQIFLVMANANPNQGYKGITCFIIERNTPGLIIGKPEKKLGIKASGTCMVTFDNLVVAKSQVLGQVGQAYKYVAGILNEGRIGIAAQMLGLAQGCFDATIPYTLQRKQFNSAIFDFQAMQHQIAEVALEIECLRTMTYNAARMLENGDDVMKVGAMVKYLGAQVAQKTTVKCIDWMGGVGFTEDFPQEKYYRDCKIGSIYEGTSNIQLSTIAKIIKNQYQQ